MNYVQKLGYIALGGVIAIAGMMAASVFTPNLVAQKDVFDEIRCRKLVVENADGKFAVRLGIDQGSGVVAVRDRTGNYGVSLHAAEGGGGIDIDGKKSAMSLIANQLGGIVTVFSDNTGISLITTKGGSSVKVDDEKGNDAVILRGEKHGGSVTVFDSEGEVSATYRRRLL